MAMLKDNHLKMVTSVPEGVAAIKKARPGILVEVECETLAEVNEALQAGADIIMLDNMGLPLLKKAIARIRAWAKKKNVDVPPIEISGGVTLATIGTYARLGVDRISVGALTHSAQALDISLEFHRQ
jgi:nicotinate-nucleotide pyrophosphorylase (carboxylating)